MYIRKHGPLWNKKLLFVEFLDALNINIVIYLATLSIAMI